MILGGGCGGGGQGGLVAAPTVKRPGTNTSGFSHNDPPAIAALKQQLLIDAIEKSPRLRTDLDLVVIIQFLGSLDSLAQVSPHVVHYLATECSVLSLRDGDVFCYQEDPVTTDSSALVIIEGSLCGYVNKQFSQRDDASESFSNWNARQNRRRGVLVDFGEIQTTYAAGALCSFDDVLVGVPPATSSSLEMKWHRRRGIHAQEQTRAIVFKKDTLDRAAHRFGLVLERGVLHSRREAASADIAHLAIFTPFSDSARQALLQNAPRRLVPRGESLFASSGNASTINAFAIVLSGRLDIYWTGSEHQAIDSDSDDSDDDDRDNNDSSGSLNASQSSTSSANNAMVFRRSPLFSIRRGQTLGDQSLGLALDQLFTKAVSQSGPSTSSDASATPHPPAANQLSIRIVSGEDNTEVLLVPFALYHEKRTEDHILLQYAALLKNQRENAPESSTVCVSALADWAPSYFAAKMPEERTLHDLQQLLWQLNVDSVVAKTFFQFPPLVLERISHAMELAHFPSQTPTRVLEEGNATDEVFVVVHGALRGAVSRNGESPELYVPGDVFGLKPRGFGASDLYADAETMLLCIHRSCIDRWLVPVKSDLVTDAGSLFDRHRAYIAAHPPRHSSANDKRKSLTAMARRVSAQAAQDDETTSAQLAQATAHTEALAGLLKRMDFLASVPRFLLQELLTQGTIVHKQPGEVVFQENEATSTLVVVLSGFLRVFTLENMGPTLEMFHKHTFCNFVSLHHLLTKQQSLLDQDADGSDVGSAHRGRGGGAPSVLTRHRSMMYGIHFQTLHAHNAFRTGVLQGNTKCPATIVAQTPCDLLVIDESVYAQVLKQHVPIVDLARYELLHGPGSGNTPASVDKETKRMIAVAGGQRLCSSRAVPVALLKYVETIQSPLSWLSTLTLPKRQLLLRQAKLLILHPGERLFRHGELVDHVFVVVSGSLAVYVRQHHERVANALDASQRSVRSLMLERTVTSNYSTTSHQLNSSVRGTDPRRLQHKRAMLKHKVNRMVTAGANATLEPSGSEISNEKPVQAPTSLFVQSVLAAVREDKRKASITAASLDAAGSTGQGSIQSASPRKSVTALTLHAAVSRATLAHRLDQHRGSRGAASHRSSLATGSNGAQDEDEDTFNNSEPMGSRSSTILCHLHAGDVYGEEALSQLVYRCPHDVFAELTAAQSSSSSGTNTSGSTSSSSLPQATTIEILCIDRRTFLAIQAKSDDEIEQELRGRSKAATSKWQLAEQIVISNRKASTGSTTAKTPKLFDLFKNILNQRYYLTMRAIADIPLLCDLPDAIKRELCIGARFEALERFANAYKDDSRSQTATSNATGSADQATAARHRYYFVLSGRVGLFPKSAVHGNSSSASGASSLSHYGGGGNGSSHHGSVAVASSAPAAATSSSGYFPGVLSNMDACLQEVTTGSGFGEFEVLVAEASRHHVLAVALENTKLLSLPGDLFVKFWPQVADLQQNIHYLRHGVRYFQRLEMEKISYLYHALRNETFTRGAKILEHTQPMAKNEVILLKEGECSIKNKVTIESHEKPEDDDHGGEGRSGNPRQSDPKSPRSTTGKGSAFGGTNVANGQSLGHHQVIRVLATIADVREGHVFWLDGTVAPFTLQTISARVGIARIAVDKLRAILPKSHFLQLEESSEAFAALYRDQLANARRTIVRVMNEKRNAELGRSSTGGGGDRAMTFLPSLHYNMQVSSKKAQLQALTATGRRGKAPHTNNSAVTNMRARKDDDRENGSDRAVVPRDAEPPGIPYARILSSKPVDLAAIQTEERSRHQHAHNTHCAEDQDCHAEDDGDGGTSDEVMGAEWKSDLDLEYQNAHQLEHYRLAEDMASIVITSALRGSFPDDLALRRSHRWQRRSGGGANTADIPPVVEVHDPRVGTTSATAKDEELSLPETTSNASSRMQLQVTLPSAAVRPIPKPKSAKKSPTSFIVDYLGDPATDLEADEKEMDGMDLVMDLRGMLQAELQSPFSPLRSIRLAPSECKLHSQGKYSATPHPPTALSPPPPEQPLPPMLPVLPGQIVDTVSSPRALPLGWKATTPRNLRLERARSNPSKHSVISRKEGFLCLVPVPADAVAAGYIQDQFLRAVVHRQKRRLFTLEESVLREYAEEARLHDVAARPLAVFNVEGSEITDAPTVHSGESEVVLRHSFMLHLRNDSSVVLLTAESAVDKKSWMQATRTASTMGRSSSIVAPPKQTENGSLGSPMYKHRQSVAVSLANRETRRLSSVSGGGRNAVVHSEEVLEVEYRIS